MPIDERRMQRLRRAQGVAYSASRGRLALVRWASGAAPTGASASHFQRLETLFRSALDGQIWLTQVGAGKPAELDPVAGHHLRAYTLLYPVLRDLPEGEVRPRLEQYAAASAEAARGVRLADAILFELAKLLRNLAVHASAQGREPPSSSLLRRRRVAT